MKNRSELREIIMKVLYQISIYEETKLDYSLKDMIHEQLEIENSFVNDSLKGIIDNKKTIHSNDFT